jgi:hypothetical protein
MLVATLCTRPAAKLLLVSRVQHVHAPARHNMCVVEKLETAAIAFHVVFHSKVKSIVVFVMHVGDTSCADCEKKKPVARVWRKHYALRNACTKCRSSRDKFVYRLVAWIDTSVCSQCCRLSKHCRDSKMCGACKAVSCVCVICSLRPCPVLLACLRLGGDMESSSYCGENPACQHSVETCDCYYMTHCKKHNWVFECDKCLFSHCRSDVCITSLIRVRKSLSYKKG